jgi:Zn-dependent protease/predicted transcriptional regulator
MHETVSFGRVLGIRVGANWSLLIIAALLMLGLAVGVLPEAAPDSPTWLAWVVAAFATALFFASLLAHELAHAVVARREGIPVGGITLWALGGVSKLEEDSPDAGVELRVAVVGPATSLAIGLAFGFVAAVAAALQGPDLLVAASGWLAMINVLLAVFNMAPAFPLDGGRVLRALLWRHHGDRQRATVTAAEAGRIFGYLLVALGVVMVWVGAFLNGIWFAVLGWFVVNLSQAERNRVEAHDLLAGVTVGQVMSAEPLCVPPGLTIASFLDQYVLTHRYSSYPVVDDEHRPLGIITLASLRGIPAASRNITTVGEASFGPGRMATAMAHEPLESVLPRLAANDAARLVVVESGRVVGILSRTDVAGCLERRAVARQPTG